MLVELGKHVVRAVDQEAEPWRGQPERFAKAFSLGDGLQVKFDRVMGGSVRASLMQPALGDPFYRIAPQDMGAARWMSLERDLDVVAMRGLGQVIPVLDATAPRSLSLFALLRVTLNNGRRVETSSTQVELRRQRQAASFPISLDDLPSESLANARSVRLIFFIEARDVELDFYSLEVVGVPRPNPTLDSATIANLQDKARYPGSEVVIRTLEIPSVTGASRFDSFLEMGVDVNLDVDSARGEYIEYSSARGGVVFDYAHAHTSRWRTIEFRFTDQPVSAFTTAMISLQGAAQSDASWTSVPIRIREYSVTEWRDTNPVDALDIGIEQGIYSVFLEIRPHLVDDKGTHTFGLILFVPPECSMISVDDFRAVLYNRASNAVSGTVA